LERITALRSAQIQKPVADGALQLSLLRSAQIQKPVADGALQLSLFDQIDLAEITHLDYPGERLVVCRNPLLAAARERKRAELMAAAEKRLDSIGGARKSGCLPQEVAFWNGDHDSVHPLDSRKKLIARKIERRHT
jgi:hypothetical protein